MSSNSPVRFGVLGMGRAFTLMLPTFLGDTRVQLVAGFDPRPSARHAFHLTFGGQAYTSEEEVCSDKNVEWIYIATPHQLHASHVTLAASHGKHILVEKPLSITLEDGKKMVDTCKRAGVHLLVGHSHSFNGPVLHARQLIESEAYGEIRMIQTLQYTDFMYRPRRPEELDTRQGGGVVFSQAAHQVDIVRLLGGGLVKSVRAHLGRWDSTRPTEGAYAALLSFQNHVFASISYNGYGYFDSDCWMNDTGEMGQPKLPNTHTSMRVKLSQVADEATEMKLKSERNFGGTAFVMPDVRPPTRFQHFGPVIVSCDKADLRLTPYGIEVIDAHRRHLLSTTLPLAPRGEVIDEIWRVARQGQQPLHDGKWALGTLEVCLAMFASDARGCEVQLLHQVAPAPIKNVYP